MISAIILAAGQSKRMGKPKMLLPWGEETVLGHVISVIRSSGVEDILVVTGNAREDVEALAKRHDVRAVFNADYERGEMLNSIQCGLGSLRPEAEAALICLGDQPQVEERSVLLVVEEYARTGASLIVPSYRMRRGHPWLMARAWWKEILEMRSPESPREFLNRHSQTIHYVNINSPSVLADLDTPEDYLKSRP